MFSRRRVELNDLANEHKCFVFNGIYVRLTFFSGKVSQSCLDRRDPGSGQHPLPFSIVNVSPLLY